MQRTEKLKELQNILGYQFNDIALLDLALTPPAYRGRNPESVKADNQRLEFLGDAVYGVLAAEYVYLHSPDLAEGELTLRVTHMANGHALAELARACDLDTYILASGLPVDERSVDRTLEDALEAVFGAVWCDGGYAAAAQLFKNLLPKLPEMPAERWFDNPKGALQELAQRYGWPNSPAYTLIDSQGPDHDPAYTMLASVYGGYQAQCTAGTKRAAEVAAAEALIHILKANGFEV
ncbi:MAG: ribonuclease III domain-containing protein [Kiritimatiellae bacterium]|nr:ribonuclease III domain-containing protein [Kiritimatiellia bacterium]